MIQSPHNLVNAERQRFSQYPMQPVETASPPALVAPVLRFTFHLLGWLPRWAQNRR